MPSPSASSPGSEGGPPLKIPAPKMQEGRGVIGRATHGGATDTDEVERKAREAQRKREEQQAAALEELKSGKLNFAAMLQAARFAKRRNLDAFDTDEDPDDIVEVTGTSGRVYGGRSLCGLRPVSA